MNKRLMQSVGNDKQRKVRNEKARLALPCDQQRMTSMDGAH